MTNDDRVRSALVDSPRVYYNLDGTIEEQQSTVEVRVNYTEIDELRFEPEEMENEDKIEELAEKYEPGEVIDSDYYNGAYARLRYSVEDGKARLASFKDVEPENSGWMSVEFFRVIGAAERVVQNVPGVEEVEHASDTLDTHIYRGLDAEVSPA